MELEWEQLVIDARDMHALAGWWADALGWVTVGEAPDEVEIRPAPDRLPGLLFTEVPEAKTVKNRLHLDFRPADQAAAVEHFVSRGATHVDVGQDDTATWVVLADPEGNEFCVLSDRR